MCCCVDFYDTRNQLLFIHFWCSISLNPTPLVCYDQMICGGCKRTKLEKLYQNKSFECCCSPAPVIIYYYWGEHDRERQRQSYHIFLAFCEKKLLCRIFHVNVPLIEIYDISTHVLYIFIIFYDDDIFFITHTHSDIIFHFSPCAHRQSAVAADEKICLDHVKCLMYHNK